LLSYAQFFETILFVERVRKSVRVRRGCAAVTGYETSVTTPGQIEGKVRE
jgi:hypothetical protein